MCYPLFFIYGEPVWRPGTALKHDNEKDERSNSKRREQITTLQFYPYRLAIRSGFSPIHYGGKLFHQFLVDCYVKTEGKKISKKNQLELNNFLDFYN